MQIIITKDNGIGIVAVNRPESLNAMNKDVIIEFAKIFTARIFDR